MSQKCHNKYHKCNFHPLSDSLSTLVSIIPNPSKTKIAFNKDIAAEDKLY